MRRMDGLITLNLEPSILYPIKIESMTNTTSIAKYAMWSICMVLVLMELYADDSVYSADF